MKTNRDVRELTAADARDLAAADASHAERIVLIWQRPTIPDADIPDASGLSYSAWAEIKKRGEGPPLFEIGRRVFVLTDDLRKWLQGKAAQGKPGNKKLRASGDRLSSET